MELTSVMTIKELLLKYNAMPSKYLGQNFLIEQSVLSKIIKASELTKKDTVLEIGPGIGTLTKELAKKAGKVIAIEKDKTMVEILKETLKNFKNVEIIQGNALKFDPKSYKLKTKNYKIVANIPYYITSPVIRKFLESENQPETMILMVQKEAAQRICSKPPDMSLLAVSVQFYAEVKIIFYVSKNCFWPMPKVDSAIIKIIPRNSVLVSEEAASLSARAELPPSFRDTFFKIVKAGFSQPRKQLLNNLSKSLKIDRDKVNFWLLKNNIKTTQRAETLSVKNWLDLTDSFLPG